jgi:hypothetical protein
MRDNWNEPTPRVRGNMIRHIAVPLASAQTFVTADLAGNVTLWSMASKKRLAEVRTVLDFGGTRLAFVKEPEFCLLIAARFEGPLSAYDLSGRVLWSRKDLAGVQHVTQIPNRTEPLIGVGSEGQPYRVLAVFDGKEVIKLDKVSKIYSNPGTMQILATGADRSASLVGPDWKTIWKHPLKSFAVLHGWVSDRYVAYSEAAGGAYCFDQDGALVWASNPEPKHHFLRIACDQEKETWTAVDWNYEKGGPKRLLKLSEKGSAEPIATLEEPAETEFFATGECLITSNGSVFDSQSGRVIWDFIKEK